MQRSLINVHRNIYKYLKDKVQAIEGKKSKELLQYQKDQHNSSLRKFKKSNIGELRSSINDSDIIYLGDFHTFDQSSRNLSRIMRMIESSKQEFAIGLELVNKDHQKFIDYFLNGHITELEFLESINYNESWRFPWTYYRSFFELAKKNSIPIIALNTKGSLIKRDKEAAKVIKKFRLKFPHSKVLVLFGEYHIVHNKLPKLVNSFLEKDVIQTIIHQNLDEVYWKLVKEQKNVKDEILRFNSREFVLITSAPWLKYESQIYWYEHLSEDPDFDIHEYLIENGALNFSENVPENFLFIAEHLNETLNFSLSQGELEDFHLYDHINISQVDRVISNTKPQKISNFYYSLIKRGRSFQILGTRKYFCPNYSINRISYLAGIHCFHAKLSELGHKTKKILEGSDREAIFVLYLYQCTMAYFSSKLINPYRKCDMYKDYKSLIKSRSTKESKKKLYKVGLSLMTQRKNIQDQIKGIRLLGIYNLARMTGHMYGDILFDHFFIKGDLKFHSLINIILNGQFDNESFSDFKDIINEEVEIKKMSKRIF